MATPTEPRSLTPLTDRERRAAELTNHHELETPELTDAFQHLAMDHPDAITYDPTWTPEETTR